MTTQCGNETQMATTTINTTQDLLVDYFARLPKRAAVEASISALFLALGRRSTESSRQLHVLALMDLDTPLLIGGLSKALLTTKDWLTPGAVRELCEGSFDAQLTEEAEEAWTWVMAYVHKWGKRYGAAEIPAAIEDALAAIAGTPAAGLERVGLEELSKLPFLKREFVAAYVRKGRQR